MNQLQPVFTDLDISALLSKWKNLQKKIPDKDDPKEVCRSFARQIRDTLLTAFNLQFKLINWTKKEIKEIDNYYYATRILIECKEAAATVSPHTWAAVEERMLRVPDRLTPSDLT
ncbi:MAG: hypothetical protein AB4290_08125 [Spirulina sp.]